MASKFAEFIQTNKIDRRRIVTASIAVEKLRPEDRAHRLTKRLGRGKDAAPAAAGEQPAAPKKPRSGHAVTGPLLDRIAAGKAISGASKTRVLRAVNRILEQKKQEPVDLRKLF